MIPIPSGVRVWIATRHPDMRRGMHPLGQTSDVLQAAALLCSKGCLPRSTSWPTQLMTLITCARPLLPRRRHLQRRGAIRIPSL